MTLQVVLDRLDVPVMSVGKYVGLRCFHNDKKFFFTKCGLGC